MRKQTKLVAVLSAAALLALGASMTSFAAGWEKDEAGIWHYYDSDDDMVTDEWKKDGGKWFYLNDDGDMLTDAWVDDDYYVGSDGAMLVNQWYKGFGDDDEQDDPTDDGEHWYYFGSKGKKEQGKSKKIGGKTYFFDDEGRMRYGWYEQYNSNSGNYDVYYLGTEDEGWRAENQWLWLEKSGMNDDDDDNEFDVPVLGCKTNDDCDEEGWYWFQSSGKMFYGAKQKKINGNFFVFNDHGQMLYEWINASTKVARSSNWQLDGIASAKSATVGQMRWFRENGSDSIDGSRMTGWVKIDGSEDVGSQDDTEWYYIKKGKAKAAGDVVKADGGKDDTGLTDDGAVVFRKREKIDGKWFVFNEKGEMQTGLQYVDGNTYYFDSDGYQKTGKQTSVEEGDDSTYVYYFKTKNAGNGQGQTGPKDGYLYWNGKRLEAPDNYMLYKVGDFTYLVNKKGKLQKNNGKNYDLDDPTTGDVIEKVNINMNKSNYHVLGGYANDEELVVVPHIELFDNWLIDKNGVTVPIAAQSDDYLTIKEANSLSAKFDDVNDNGDEEPLE